MKEGKMAKGLDQSFLRVPFLVLLYLHPFLLLLMFKGGIYRRLLLLLRALF